MDKIKDLAEKDPETIKRIIELAVAGNVTVVIATTRFEKETYERQTKEAEEERKYLNFFSSHPTPFLIIIKNQAFGVIQTYHPFKIGIKISDSRGYKTPLFVRAHPSIKIHRSLIFRASKIAFS